MEKEVDLIELGKRIKFARNKVKMSQSKLSEKTGISTTAISGYENGTKSIGLRSLAKIASVTGTTMDEIFCGENSLRPITLARNKGELIVNCVAALFEEGVICLLSRQKENKFMPCGYEWAHQMGFARFIDVLDDLVNKLDDFAKNEKSYPDPQAFKEQLLASAIKKINDH